MKFDPNSRDPIVRALAAQEARERRKADGVVDGGRLSALPARRCRRCDGRRLIEILVDAKTMRLIPCPTCSHHDPEGGSAPDFGCDVVDMRIAA